MASLNMCSAMPCYFLPHRCNTNLSTSSNTAIARTQCESLYNILCTVNIQHTSRLDGIITIRLYLATCFGRDRPSSGQLRTILKYSKDSTQRDPISFMLNVSGWFVFVELKISFWFCVQNYETWVWRFFGSNTKWLIMSLLQLLPAGPCCLWLWLG